MEEGNAGIRRGGVVVSVVVMAGGRQRWPEQLGIFCKIQKEEKVKVKSIDKIK
jgi:hypothetical protein